MTIMVRKPKRILTVDEMVRMALMRFGVGADGQGFTPMKSLVDTFGREQAVISRAILRAFREGHVRLVPAESASRERIRELEEAVERRFKKTKVIVVKSSPPAEDVERARQTADDDLHRILGTSMASLIATSHMMRDGDVIGVGGGRAVYFTAEALSRMVRDQPIPVDDIALVALVGSLFPQDLAGRLHMKLDADLHANMLGPCFQGGRPRTLNVPLSFRDSQRVSGTLKDWMSSDALRERDLTHALVGLGVVDDTHRLRRLADVPKDDYMFGGVRQELAELIALSDRYRNEEVCYIPLAEVCCRLFVVEPNRVAPKALSRMQELIGRIDQRLLSVPASRLNQIRALLLVAGGRRKGAAIREFLARGSWQFRYLCTDEEAAAGILA